MIVLFVDLFRESLRDGKATVNTKQDSRVKMLDIYLKEILIGNPIDTYLRIYTVRMMLTQVAATVNLTLAYTSKRHYRTI